MNVGKALGAFVRHLVTRSRWDEFLDGDDDALSDDEKKGLGLFISLGCIACHQQRTLGGGMQQKLGLMKPWQGEDKGRAEVSGSATEEYFFKVAPLLNVEKTAPYYHDGSIATLEEAVRHMADVQLNRKISDSEVRLVVTFLRTLTGDKPDILKQGD